MTTVLLVLIDIAFISLGLPDAVLGGGWPAMQPDFGVPYGFAGLVSMTISGGTILSAVFSSRVLKRFGTGKVTAFSVALTAAALFGFAMTPSFWWLLLAATSLVLSTLLARGGGLAHGVPVDRRSPGGPGRPAPPRGPSLG